MNTEKLKVIAEGLGHEAWVCVNEVYKGQVRIKLTGVLAGTHDEYNPLTNNDQMVEIMERLKVILDGQATSKEWWAFSSKNSGDELFEGVGKTINEAVVNAAYEYFKDNASTEVE